MSWVHYEVGDPVDVVTGANSDVTCDFQLAGPLPLSWNRYYDSARTKLFLPLGWGHTHEYDRSLCFDLEGMHYTLPDGHDVEFPPLVQVGETAHSEGFTLRRVAHQTYYVSQNKLPTAEFKFHDFQRPARLSRLFQGSKNLEFSYGAQGVLEGIVDSLGRYIRVQNNDRGQLLSLILNDAEKTLELIRYRYDNVGNLIEVIDFYGYSLCFSYDDERRMTARKDRRGYSFYFEYDKRGRCVHSYGEDGLLEVRLQYDSLWGQTVVAKADGGEWIYRYTDRGTVVQIIDPYGGIQVFNMDTDGRIVEEIDTNGNITRIVYNRNGGLTEKLDPLGYFLRIPEEFNNPHPLEHRVGQCPAEWEFGNLVRWKAISLSTPNASGLGVLPTAARRFIQTDAESYEHLFVGSNDCLRLPSTAAEQVFDELGLLVKQQGYKNQSRKWSYDPNGNIRRYFDYEGSEYNFQYTSWNLLSKSTNPLGHTINYEYTQSEQIAAVVDPGSTRSEYRYDLKDRLVEIRRHGVLKEEYRYDNGDNLVEKLDGAGKTLLSIENGPANLKRSRHLASGQNQYFYYDNKGRCVRAATDNIECTFAYAVSKRTEDKRNGLGVSHVYEGGRLKQTTVFDRFVIRYERDPDGTLRIHDPGGMSHVVRVLDNGIVCRETSNGLSEVTQYDAQGRCLVKITYINALFAPWYRQYEWSAEGDFLLVNDNHFGSIRYIYDKAHRLSQIVPERGSSQLVSYDEAANLLAKPGLSGVSLSDGNRLAAANGSQFQYNDRNHISVREYPEHIVLYEYDSRDLLRRIDVAGREWHADYDPFGRRVWKSFGEGRTQFYWDTDRLVAEINELGGLRIYVYADDLALVPMLFVDYETVEADPASGRRFFVFCNHLGAPLLVSDDVGDVVWNVKLEPYGMADVISGDSFHMPLRFPGHYYDSETGLHYNRFRYYSPELGRYLQTDPDGVAGGLNLYSYTESPLKQVDVRGLGCPHNDGKRKRVGEDGPDAEATGNGNRPSRRRMTDEELQSAADYIRNPNGNPKDFSTLTVTDGMTDDGPVHTVTTSRKTGLTDGERGRAEEVFGPQVNTPYEGPIPSDGQGNFHSEQQGIRATENQTERRQASSNNSIGEEGNFGAACAHCAARQRDAGVKNVTGTVESGGRTNNPKGAPWRTWRRETRS